MLGNQRSFEWRRGYPREPGFKREGTSADAAEAIAPRAGTLRDAVFKYISRCEDGATADEAAAALSESVLAIRPRVTELLKLGLIVETSERRLNQSGRPATVWRTR